MYERLKEEALASPKKRSRIILVPGFDMVICLHRDSYVRMHRHPRYEAYHLIEGSLAVAEESGTKRVYYKLDPIACIPPMTWHQPAAVTEFAIYREFYCGPFEKVRDVEYAQWAKEEAA